MNNSDLLKIVLWVGGICTTGFFVLLTMVLKVPGSVTHPLNQIRDALLGDFDKPGLITKVHNNGKSIADLKNKFEKHHE